MKPHEEIKSGKAHITWAVFQFANDPKLKQLQADNDLELFLGSLADEDPYELRELPPINGIKQYIVMGRENELPYMESGVTEKAGNEIIANQAFLEKMQEYATAYPGLKPIIDDGLAKIQLSDCTSCDQRKLLRKLAAAVKEAEAAETKLATPPAATGVRPACADCARKHISQAIILIQESQQGYPAHRWLAVGHLAEAADESLAEWPWIAAELREHRLQLMDDPEYIPELMTYLEDWPTG